MRNTNVVLFLALNICAMHTAAAESGIDREVTNLRAFTKLYGYVRFFHPSDEAASIDWDKLAIYGAKKIRFAHDTHELKILLQEIFVPVAPTIQIYDEQETPRDVMSYFPKDTTGLHVTAWQHRGAGKIKSRDDDNSAYRSVRVNESDTSTYLFKTFPRIGESFTKPLGDGLWCRVPLALYADSSGTIGGRDSNRFHDFKVEVNDVHLDAVPTNNVAIHLADVVTMWNVMQHFYPYFDVVGTNWDAELTKALERTLHDSLEKNFVVTMEYLIAALKDGHGYYYSLEADFVFKPPFELDWVQNAVVVRNTTDTVAFHRGDIIDSIDGKSAIEELRDCESRVSGSPQHQRVYALYRFGGGADSGISRITINRDGKHFTKNVERGTPHFSSTGFKYKNVMEVRKDIYYINLNKISDGEIKLMLTRLAQGGDSTITKGIIFDLRGYPSCDPEFLSHLTRTPLRSARWNIPQIIYPDQEHLAGYDTLGRWDLPVESPRFGGKIIFLTNAFAISYAESVMGIVENYKLGEIVGQTTAGTNGNINPFALPDGSQVTWTGMKVLKHDGSQHHLIGIQPTVLVQHTIQAIIDQRDEDLNKAIDIIGGVAVLNDTSWKSRGLQDTVHDDGKYHTSTALNLDFERVATNNKPASWHTGRQPYDTQLDSAVYHSGHHSLRIHCDSNTNKMNFGVGTSTFPVDSVRGKYIHLSGYIKTENVANGFAGLWMRVDASDRNHFPAFDNMQDRGVTKTTGWARYDVELFVDSASSNINFGALLTGSGTAWFDQLQIDLDGVPYEKEFDPRDAKIER